MYKKYSTFPFVFWSAFFIVLPLFLIVFYSLTAKGTINFTLENFSTFLTPKFMTVLARSLVLSIKATAICIILGYPMAYIISRMEEKKQKIAVMLFVLPMWMNFLLRTYAWVAILNKNGIINNILGFINIAPLNLLYNEFAIILGMVYNFIPFMVFPIYTVLNKMDESLLEAARDLGASTTQTFLKVILPLSIPGIVSGITMVFLPALSTFVISSILGGGRVMLIGNLVQEQFLVFNNWNFGSAISMVLMAFIIVSMLILNRFESEDSRGGIGI
jgi:spermidine/putrescine transport system permease protein